MRLHQQPRQIRVISSARGWKHSGGQKTTSSCSGMIRDMGLVPALAMMDRYLKKEFSFVLTRGRQRKPVAYLAP